MAVAGGDGQKLQCMEVWGGSQRASAGVEFGGLEAWVYSNPYGEAHSGGDVYYASSCATGRISRVLLADVSGHGQTVASTAADLRTLMRRFVNRLDQAEFVRLLNEQFNALTRAGVFATAIVSTYFAPTRRLMICNAGHPRPLLYRAKTGKWTYLSYKDGEGRAGAGNVPLGLLEMAEYEHFDVELEPGDCVLSYTDALMESRDADGEMLDERGVLRIVRLLGGMKPKDLIEALLKEIADRHAGNLSEDDVTVLVVRATAGESRYTLRDRVGAMVRFSKALAGSLHPRGERAPLPDANLANIGGAIIPALARRWRAAKQVRELR